MLLHGLAILGGLFISISILYLCNKIRKYHELKKKVDRFPGPKMTPIIGDFDCFTKTREELFHLFRKRAATTEFRTGFRCWYFFEPVISFAEANNIERIISTVEHIEKGWSYQPLKPWLGNGLLTSSGSNWHKRRKILTPAFHFNILQEFLRVFHSESLSLVEVFRENSNKCIDIKPYICQFTLNSICDTAMGISLKSVGNRETYRKSLSDFVEVYIERMRNAWLLSDAIFYFSKFYSIQQDAIRVLHDFSTKVIAERKKYVKELIKFPESSYSKKKRVAMLDLLLMNQLQLGEMDDESIREEVDTFTFEGHDTTSLSLTYTLMLLANNRDCQDKIYDEIQCIFGDSDAVPNISDLQELKYMEMCIKESLRLYPSVPIITRIASSDIETEEGLVVPKGCELFILVSELHRNPAVFPNPEKFDPDRFLPENTKDRLPFAYLPFSGGPRNCIGQRFAILELKCCLVEILKNFILEPIDTPDDLIFEVNVVLRNEGPVRMRFVPRT